MKRKNINYQKAVSTFVLASLIITIIFIIFSFIKAPSEVIKSDEFIRLRSDYALMFIQCILGVFAMLLPSFLKHRINIEIPSNMMILYTIFLYCAIYLGEVRSFYYAVPHWDTILHTFSGAMLGALGFSVIAFLNKTEGVPINLSPSFVAVFAFCFAVTMGVFWEIYEFLSDGILGLNMQKFMLKNGELLSGREALMDTMKDLIVDSLGAFVISLMGYISLKNKKGWVEKLLLAKKNK